MAPGQAWAHLGLTQALDYHEWVLRKLTGTRKWYNKGKCAKGASCPYEHSCNRPRGGKWHPRVENHLTKPE